ncbi:MAG: hypothetical protein GMKNLPBB_02271 [Myxococcota bacterium]|nr:hypothetical protein [Myxococcota bacterium]
MGRKRVVVDQTVFPFDCSNFVRAAVLGGGTDLFEDARGVWDTNGAGMIQRWAQNRGRFFRDGDPAPGDLVFWDNTYDRNHNGLWDDPLTHIGIVEHVDADGQITFIHKGAREITRGFMNLRAPSERRRNGREINSWLRWASPGKDEGADRLAGNLFAGYARVYGPAPQPPARAEESPSSGGGSRREDGGGLRPSPIFRASPDRHQRMEGITP